MKYLLPQVISFLKHYEFIYNDERSTEIYQCWNKSNFIVYIPNNDSLINNDEINAVFELFAIHLNKTYAELFSVFEHSGYTKH